MWRVAAVLAAVLWAFICLLPTYTDNLPGWWKSLLLPNEPIHLGLDLQGGIHMVLQVESDKAVQNTVDRMMDQIRRELREEEIATRNWKRQGQTSFNFELVSESKRDRMLEYLTDNYANLESVNNEGRNFRYKLVDLEIEGIKQLAIDQALETIRNRVDEFGVSEPTIQRTGAEGILVQLPGIDDPERAKDLIGKTAQLELRLVAENDSEPGVTMMTTEDVDPVTGLNSEQTLPVYDDILMTGEAISDARHRPGFQGESPFVHFVLNSQGSKIFADVTEENVGRKLAIVLDGVVQSAPVIRERIGGGRGQITGNFSLDQAKDLAIVLRAGALPAPVKIAEERTVGPSLGRDSIQAGLRSFAIGGLIVIVFMLFYYRFSGFIADLGLIINIIVLLGILAGMQATLTLPGIAGIVLTLGMAVDANVLINERIREELRLGQTAHSAVEAGYSHALPAIIDSNVTTFLAGLVLFQFGSGPIKGFAVTLCSGIISTVFSAVFASRVIYDVYLSGRSGRELSI